MDFMDLEKVYDRVNRETLCQVRRMYDEGEKLLNGIKTMYVDSLACDGAKGSEIECFRIDSSVRQRLFLSPWPFNVYMDAWVKEMKIGMGRRGLRLKITWLFLCR